MFKFVCSCPFHRNMDFLKEKSSLCFSTIVHLAWLSISTLDMMGTVNQEVSFETFHSASGIN